MTAPTPSRLGSAQIRQELAIPERHCTAPQHLLSWPCSLLSLTERKLRYPVDIEIKFLILDEDEFYANHLNQALRTGFAGSLDSCLVLLVLSLGSLAACHTGSREWSQSDSIEFISDYEAGLCFFNLASDIFRDVEAADWGSVQCLLLIAGSRRSASLRHVGTQMPDRIMDSMPPTSFEVRRYLAARGGANANDSSWQNQIDARADEGQPQGSRPRRVDHSLPLAPPSRRPRAVHAPDPAALSDKEVAGARTTINSAITGILHGGIMHEPLELLLFPMTPGGPSVFATEIILLFIKRIPNRDLSEALLLPCWEAVH
ncbi:hypothetical protein CSOJ01_12159 [Colletotrichum sojae]|uniref:Uncharacterized protein n=1 Tax=Colletotrichum sojae TaxID=2175907 RepID=A0A8H6MMR2_9PEZI|nr:hypothetical protein CSOJ01_12159 [Colletotrichum sojae]